MGLKALQRVELIIITVSAFVFWVIMKLYCSFFFFLSASHLYATNYSGNSFSGGDGYGIGGGYGGVASYGGGGGYGAAGGYGGSGRYSGRSGGMYSNSTVGFPTSGPGSYGSLPPSHGQQYTYAHPTNGSTNAYGKLE